MWDEEVDLLVFGSGAAGMTAALVGAHEGLKVLICEKQALLGGTTATSAGTVWIPGNSQAPRDGLPDSAQKGRAYLRAELGDFIRADLFDAFLASAPAAIDYLDTRTEVVFDPCRNNPDYHPDAPNAAWDGRALAPRPFDGRRLGPDFETIRSPRETLLVFGGMMVGRRELPDLLRPFSSIDSTIRVARILLRHAADRLRFKRGTRLILGNALVARFLTSLRKTKVRISLGSGLANLVEQDGQVVGAVVETAEGMRRICARRGVVLATGGFPGNAEMRSQWMAEYPGALSYAFETSRGEAIEAAQAVGGVLDTEQMGPAWWTPVSVLKRPDGSEAVWAHHSMDRGKPGIIAVNAAGKRFVNEGISYHDFVLGMYRSHKSVPTVPAYFICDRPFIRRYGLGLIRPIYQRLRPWIDAGYLIRAGSIAELARRVGVDPDGLEETVARNNRFAETGVDEDFGKGSDSMSRYNGDSHHAPNPCLGPIRSGPFFALPIHPGVIGTCVGLKTDADARVLNAAGQPIKGLFACGNDMASVMRGAYPGPGITLGPAITFAYRAVMQIAAR